MKHLTQSLLLLLSLLCSQMNALAQTIGQWNVYPSYMNATKCVALDGVVYTLTDGNLFSYDPEDEAVHLFNSLEELNDVRIVQIGASSKAKCVILVYENGNIDLLDTKGKVANISALKDRSISNKNINALTVVEETAYICTGFGFLAVDMQEGVIRDTYKLDIDCRGILIKNDKAYLLQANNTILTVEDNENWHIRSNWKATTSVRKEEITGQAPEYIPANGIFWHAEGMKGLVGYKDKDGNKESSQIKKENLVKVSGPIQPNSPVRDLFYRMNYVGDRLLVAGGINTPFAIYNPATAMIYEDGEWTYLDEETPARDFPRLHHWNTTHLTQDPNDPEHHFASPYRTGLYEYRNRKLVKIYSIDNSPLQQIENYGVNYVSANAPTYDEEGNLWVLNNQTDTIIRILQPDGKWQRLYYEEIAGTQTPDDYLFTRSGVKFVVSRRVAGRGFFGFYTNGTLGNVRDDKHVLRTDIVNQDGTVYDLSEFYCMTEDMDGRVWCGTIGGLFIINDPARYFDDDFRFEQIKIARNDGSGYADYLLNGVSIRCIAVDGANRKWIGTYGNGLYLVSADGQEMLQHFTADDSPLLSNNIQCLAIHPTTGMVMIGTDMGLCSYISDATEAEEELDEDNILAYPNPVTPDYNGPITIKGLTFDSEVKICSSTGQLVWSGTSNGGTFTWNGCNKQGRRVASGVYHVIANTADGKNAVVTRIIVIR